jgi:hypothetical protein
MLSDPVIWSILNGAAALALISFSVWAASCHRRLKLNSPSADSPRPNAASFSERRGDEASRFETDRTLERDIERPSLQPPAFYGVQPLGRTAARLRKRPPPQIVWLLSVERPDWLSNRRMQHQIVLPGQLDSLPKRLVLPLQRS